jgi:repressor of nif and glnA expression
MEPIEQNQKPQPTKNSQTNTVPIRVHKDIARAIRRDLAKLNKKEFGRRIRVDDYVAKAISKLTEDDKRELQQASLSNADRLELMYREHAKGNPSQFSKEQFLGRLIADFTEATMQATPAPNGPENEGEKSS